MAGDIEKFFIDLAVVSGCGNLPVLFAHNDGKTFKAYKNGIALIHTQRFYAAVRNDPVGLGTDDGGEQKERILEAKPHIPIT